MARILLIGANGNLGSAIHTQLAQQSAHQLYGLTRRQIDLNTQLDKLPQMLDDISPEIIINAAAYTHVDNAENDTEAI